MTMLCEELLLEHLKPGKYDVTVRINVSDTSMTYSCSDVKQVYPPIAGEYDLDVMRDYYLVYGYVVVERKG